MSQSPPLDLQLVFRVVRCGYGTLAAIAPPSCRRLKDRHGLIKSYMYMIQSDLCVTTCNHM